MFIFSYRFDHLHREPSDFEHHESDHKSETWRLAFDKELTDYIKERYPYGSCTVVGKHNGDKITLTAFIESHKFEPKNYW